MLWTISVCNSIYKLKKSCLKDIKLGTRVCPKEEMTPIDLVITGQGQGSNYNGHQPPPQSVDNSIVFWKVPIQNLL